MHHLRGQAREAAQGQRGIQVAQQRGDAVGAQLKGAFGRRGQGHQTQAAGKHPGHPQAYITTADDQDAGAPKTRGQGTRSGGIQNGMGALD
jgi:hypothetical protein